MAKGILDKMKAHLEYMAQDAGKVRVFPNSDGSIDGELLVKIEKGESLESALEELEERGRTSPHKIARASYATGFRWEPSNRDEGKNYDRHRGLFQVFSHYYSNLQSAIALTETQSEHMRSKRYRKPTQAIVRIHWNARGTKPTRIK